MSLCRGLCCLNPSSLVRFYISFRKTFAVRFSPLNFSKPLYLSGNASFLNVPTNLYHTRVFQKSFTTLNPDFVHLDGFIPIFERCAILGAELTKPGSRTPPGTLCDKGLRWECEWMKYCVGIAFVFQVWHRVASASIEWLCVFVCECVTNFI